MEIDLTDMKPWKYLKWRWQSQPHGEQNERKTQTQDKRDSERRKQQSKDTDTDWENKIRHFTDNEETNVRRRRQDFLSLFFPQHFFLRSPFVFSSTGVPVRFDPSSLWTFMSLFYSAHSSVTIPQNSTFSPNNNEYRSSLFSTVLKSEACARYR